MFNILRKLGVASVLVAGLGATSAAAFTVPFLLEYDDTTDVGTVVTDHTYSLEILNFVPYEVFAYDSFAGGEQGAAKFISRNADGWGVRNASTATQFEGDRIGGGEALLFDFREREVTLDSISFTTPNDSGANNEQRFEIYVRALGSTTYTSVVTGAANPGGGAVTGAAFDLTGQGVVGSAFALVSLDTDPGTPRGLTLNSFSGTVVVPTPGSLAVLGGGLLVGGVFLRRRKAKAAS